MWYQHYMAETTAARSVRVFLIGWMSLLWVSVSRSCLGRDTSLVYQGWFGQSGATRIPSALSWYIFCRTSGIIENGGKVSSDIFPSVHYKGIHSYRARIWPIGDKGLRDLPQEWKHFSLIILGNRAFSIHCSIRLLSWFSISLCVQYPRYMYCCQPNTSRNYPFPDLLNQLVHF